MLCGGGGDKIKGMAEGAYQGKGLGLGGVTPGTAVTVVMRGRDNDRRNDDVVVVAVRSGCSG